MRIEIVERLRPFSHKPGTSCFLPNSFLKVQVFPAKIKIFQIDKPVPLLKRELNVNIHGPVKDFTVQLDLEKGFVKVWGHASEGFFRYIIHHSQNPLEYAVSIEKSPVETLIEEAVTSPLNTPSPQQFENLSLGITKKLEWEHIRERSSLAEILPLWFRAGQLLPENIIPNYSGTADFLKIIQETISEKTLDQTQSAFTNLFLSGFQDMLSPRLEDSDYQGFELKPVTEQESGSPLFLINKGALLIRTLFVQQHKNNISILPSLLPELQCGRMTNIRCNGIGSLDLEWRKKSIRRIVLRAENDTEVHFTFQKGIKNYRLREGKSVQKAEAPTFLEVLAGKEYLLDNFK